MTRRVRVWRSAMKKSSLNFHGIPVFTVPEPPHGHCWQLYRMEKDFFEIEAVVDSPAIVPMPEWFFF